MSHFELLGLLGIWAVGLVVALWPVSLVLRWETARTNVLFERQEALDAARRDVCASGLLALTCPTCTGTSHTLRSCIR